VLLDDGGVLHGHAPAAELDHGGVQLSVTFKKRGLFHGFLLTTVGSSGLMIMAKAPGRDTYKYQLDER
jgi:hypothetical protein